MCPPPPIKLRCVRLVAGDFLLEPSQRASEGPPLPRTLVPGCVSYSKQGTLDPTSLSLDSGCEKKGKKSRFV